MIFISQSMRGRFGRFGTLGVKLVSQNGSHLLLMFYPTLIYELERVSHRTESTKDSVASIAIESNPSQM